MNSRRTALAVFAALVVLCHPASAAISIPTNPPVTQPFDGMGIPATIGTASTLPADFRVDNPSAVRTVGTFAAATSTTPRAGGANLSTSAANGIYNFGAGTAALGNSDRAVGFLSSGTATSSGNLYAQLTNNTGGTLSGLQLSYGVEKYRNGINTAGFRIQLFYSTDGSTWTNAGGNFLTAFAGDTGTNSGFATAPGATVSVANALNVSIPANATFYLAWNYSVTSGSTTTNAQALAIDDISIAGIATGDPTSPTLANAIATPNSGLVGSTTLLKVTVAPGANPTSTGINVTANLDGIGGSTAQSFFDDGTNGDVTAGDKVFSFQATVSATPGGPKTLPVSVTDAQGRSGNASIAFTVLVPTDPAGTGTANPNTVGVGGNTILSVSVTPGTNPTSTGISVVGDLSPIGGSSSQAFSGSGNVFTFNATVAAGTALGPKTILVSINDTQGRSGSATISLTVSAPTIPAGTIVISQVYGGGGNGGATLKNDYIELYNRGDVAIPLDGWSLQYGSPTLTTYTVSPLSGTIQPHRYFLVHQAAGAGGSVNLPQADATGTLTLGATAGKVALVTNTAALTSCTSPDIMDFVGYGGANCSEGSPAPLLSNTIAAFRLENGCKDTNNNASDFIALNPAPRNSSTSYICGTVEPPVPQDHVTISQIYGGGGNGGATYANDYVELYNPTTNTIDLTGWSLWYSSPTGTTWTNMQPLGASIGPGEYFLIALGAGTSGGPALPAANIIGEINLGQGAGKIALVRNGEPLNGQCPLNDADIVDFVGYGSTANCKEGASNAPDGSSTIALFRKNGGVTDTNNNGADFATGTPNPRRTAPIVEIGPAVASTDPFSNGFNAPRDASIEVRFTEAVDVTTGWFSIMCTSTGAHTSAVVNGGPRTYLITPNTSFINGEQCSVTVYRAFVHDQDTDDSAANTDMPPADFTWTFTTSTGTLPPYASNVHLTMGNPTDAVHDVNQPNNYLMEKPEFAISYNRDRGTPNWVSWHLSDEWIGTLSRIDTFRPDPEVPADWYRVLETDYSGSGFDRGHMVPNADRDKETSVPINQATFLMTNMLPQAPNNNQGAWANLENYLRTLLTSNELYIVAGGAGDGGSGSNGGVTLTIANGHVKVPAKTWKVVLVIPKQSGDDILRVGPGTRTIAVIMDNKQGINDNWETHLTSVDAVEALTGYDFFENVPDAIENAIEAGINGANPPGVVNQSASTVEDTPVQITFESASANPAAVSYTIVGTPQHGSISGSGAQRTYTPAPDYNGTDSFTFRANEGSKTSNLATMTIAIGAVNDAPAAAADSKSTAEDTTLAFAASDLAANDSTGPADEASQTLTVSSVGVTAQTHGTVSLANGVVTYAPAANFNGAASFNYTVCDNGMASLCSAGVVNVNVTPVNDAPAASVTAPSSSPEGTSVTASASVTDIDDASGFTYSWTVLKNGSSYATGTGVSITFTPNDNGAYSVEVTVSDAGGASDSDGATVNVTNVSPSASIGGSPASVSEGTSVALTSTASDAGSADTLAYSWSVTLNGAAYADGSGNTFAFTAEDNGSFVVTLTVVDDDGGSTTTTSTIAGTNVAPVVTAVSGPTQVIAAGGASTVSVSFTDAGALDTHTATFAWDDGSSSVATCAGGTCTASHTYAGAGVFGVAIALSDDDGGAASARFDYIIVVDSNGGSVTGGGFINGTGGKSNFGFNAQYKANSTLPTGQTEFNAGTINFHSTAYDWLVVAGTKAQIAGTGTVNGAGSYAFLLTAVDGDVTGGDRIDRFRIKIWNPATGAVVYDNVAGAPDDLDSANPQKIGGGNVTIHTSK